MIIRWDTFKHRDSFALVDYTKDIAFGLLFSKCHVLHHGTVETSECTGLVGTPVIRYGLRFNLKGVRALAIYWERPL